jgi:hypothetical protein
MSYPEPRYTGEVSATFQQASMLLLFAPGAPREEYFETLAILGTGAMSDEERAEFYLRHDNIWI